MKKGERNLRRQQTNEKPEEIRKAEAEFNQFCFAWFKEEAE